MSQAVEHVVIFGAGGDLPSRLFLTAVGQRMTLLPEGRIGLVDTAIEHWTDAS